MQYRILGPLEVADEHGRPTPGLGPPKQRALLTLARAACRVCSPDRSHRRGNLVRAPAAHRCPLGAGLRLGPASELGGAAAGDGDAIETRGAGYLLRAGPEQVDARRFERLVAEGSPTRSLPGW